jgi:nicotinate-nucleotide adenylyltransferase
MKRLHLHKVIWLVSPQNPMKRAHRPDGPAAFERRMASARRFARGPSMIVSDAESRLGTTYTVDTVRALRRRFRGVRFVWIMGSDNLAIFHRWRDWKTIAKLMPIAVVDRPGYTARARLSPAGRRLRLLGVPGPLNFASSTALRARDRVDST